MDRSDLSKQQLKRFGIGLTGGIGTGKSTVGRLLAQRGYAVIDADQLARRVTAPGSAGLAAIAKRFGAAVLTADGALDRAGLRQIIFAQPQLRRDLEAITHPLIRQTLYDEVAALDLQQHPRWFFYEAALIFEIASEGDYAQVWCTWCPPQVQLARIMQRDGLSLTQAQDILSSQMPAAEKARRAHQVIDTSGTVQSVAASIDELGKNLALS